jgi:hypothetical protein
MRRIHFFLIVSAALALGGCSNSSDLTGPGGDTGTDAFVRDGGLDAGSNNRGPAITILRDGGLDAGSNNRGGGG